MGIKSYHRITKTKPGRAFNIQKRLYIWGMRCGDKR